MRSFHPIFYASLIVFAFLTAGCDFGVKILEAVAKAVQGEAETRQAYHQRRMQETDGRGWTDLHRAAAKGDVAAVQRLLDQGVPVDVREKKGGTPFYEAARRGQLEVMKLLLKNGAKVDDAGREGKVTPLFVAAEYKQAEVIRFLLKNGADADHKDSFGITPLHQATMQSWHGSSEIVSILIEEGGADMNLLTNDGCNALYCAVIKNHTQAALYLLSKGADANHVHPGGTPTLYAAVTEQNMELIKALLEKGAKPNVIHKNSSTPLKIAVQTQNTEITKVLLEHGADPNFKVEGDRDTLIQAVADNNNDIVRLLLKYKADPNWAPETKDTPLTYTITAYENERIVQMLLENDADPNIASQPRMLPLYVALQRKNIKIIRKLLDHGANPMLIVGSHTIYEYAVFQDDREILGLINQVRLKRIEDRRKKKKAA